MVRSKGRRVVLFIVEGISDKNALEPIISEIIENDEVKFEFTDGDITSDYKSNTYVNITDSISLIVQRYLNKRNYLVTDLLEIVQIVDTDGAFIKEDNIKFHNVDNVVYEDEYIYTRYPKELWMRNLVKSSTLGKLAAEKNIVVRGNPVPFSIYYMSCNLDHVLHDERNLVKELKMSKADIFAEQFENKEREFINYIFKFMIDGNLDYDLSWDKIRNKSNSLNRYSNLWLYLRKYK